MAHEHPFQHLFETLGRPPAASADSVNRGAFDVLHDMLSVPVGRTGRCILLRAPRAGHGKTHLLSRIRHQLGSTHEFIPLRAAFGCRIDAATVMDDTLRQLLRHIPAGGGLTALDLVTRRLFSEALQPLVVSGEVPCQDRDGALESLRTRPVETFDFHNANAVTAQWAGENFEVLGQRLAVTLAQAAGLPACDVAFWVEALFVFASAPLEHTQRIRQLTETAHSRQGEEMEHLVALLGLLSQLDRVVLVADDLEGFSTDDSAALRLASFLGALRQAVDRLDVIVSINLDIWQSAFLPRLSGGLSDRLSEVVIELEPLKDGEIADLLDSRVPGLGKRVLDEIDVDASGRHARGLIRAAGLAWLKATAMDPAPTPTPEPVEFPAPVEKPMPAIDPAEDFTQPAAVGETGRPPAWPPPEFSVAPPVKSESSSTTATFESRSASPDYWEPLEAAFEDAFAAAPQASAPAEPAAEFLTESGWQEPPQAGDPHAAGPLEPAVSAEIPPPLPESPFQIAPPELPEPAAAETDEKPAPPAPVGPDRVDDLLRQFRERYGRGNL